MKKAVTKEMEAFAKKIVAPAGFVKEVLRDRLVVHGQPTEVFSQDCEGCLAVVVKGDERVIVFNLSMEDVYKAGRKKGRAVSCGGHTIFKSLRGHWSSFDRLGVSDSFYITHHDEGDDADPNKVLARELERVEKYLAADKDRISVPVIGHRITPERKAQDIAALKAGKSVRYMPSGFGTGYVFTAKASRGSYTQPADPKLREFFECPTMVVERLDCD